MVYRMAANFTSGRGKTREDVAADPVHHPADVAVAPFMPEILAPPTHFPFNQRTVIVPPVKFTRYFHEMRNRPDRAFIRLEWIEQTVNHPIRQLTQQDGRLRRWASISAMEGQYLRVVLLPDGETVHNAFFDRSFKP
jgi:hypothetical protein